MEEKDESLKIPNINYQYFSPPSSLSLLINDDLTNAMMFVQYLNIQLDSQQLFANFLISAINSIKNKIPMTVNNFKIRWNLLLFLGSLTQNPNSSLIQKISDDFSSEMARIDFSNLKDQISKQIIPYISSHNKISDKVATQLCLNLMKLKDQRPGIFFNILPQLQDLLSNINFDRVFKIIGHELLSLCIEPPYDFFSQLNGNYINESQFHFFFSYPINFTSPDFTQFLQTTLVLEHFPFPIPFYGKVFNSLYSSLANSSIEKKSHFVDLISELINDSIITSDNESVLGYTTLFPELIPYFLIQHQTQIYSDLDSYIELFEYKYPPSLASDVILRFRNDYRLLQLMSMLAGVDVCSGEFSVHSIPYHLQFVLDKTDDILNASHYQYFSISDHDVDIDFDFINAYTAIRLFLNILKMTKSQNLMTQINLINTYIKNIKSVVTKQMVIIDIFSLIFIQSLNTKLKDGNDFICNPYCAYLMIEKLVEYGISDYIEGAYKHFLARKPHKSDQSISLWLNLDTSSIYNAIENHNWELAEKLTNYLPYFKRIYNRAYIAYQYQTEKKEPEHSLSIVKLDIALSSFCMGDLLKELKPIFPHYQQLIEFRIKNQTDAIIEPIQETGKWIPINDFALMFDETPLDMVKRIPSFIATISISKRLSNFLNYLHLYFICAKCGEYFHAETIDDLFVFDLQRALAGPIKYGEYEKANQLCEISKIDLFQFIFEHIDYFDSFDRVFLDKIQQNYPLVSAALEISILHSNYFSKNFNQRRYSTNNDYNSIVINSKKVEKISEYYDALEEVNDEDSETKMKIDAINMISNFLIENDRQIIDDLIYKIDHQIIFDILMSKYKDEVISTKLFPIFEIVSYVGTLDERTEKINILNKIQKYSKSNDVIEDLMENGQFDIALNYLKKCVQNEALKQGLCKLISICQFDRKQLDKIFEEFGDNYEVIFTTFSSNRLILQILVNHVPEDKKLYFKALSLLPDMLLEKSKINDFNQILEFFSSNFQYLISMSSEIAVLFDDFSLLKLVKESYKQLILLRNSIITENLEFKDLFEINHKNIENFEMFHNICMSLYNYFNEKNFLIEFWISTVFKSLTNFHQIKTIRMEILLEKFFQKIKKVLSLFLSYSQISSENLELLKIIDSINLISKFNPFSRFHISLKFNQQALNSIELLNDLKKAALYIDDDNLIIKIGFQLKFDLNFYFLSKVRIQLLFGQFYEADSLLDTKKLKIDDYVKSAKLFDTQFQFFTPINKLPTFNQIQITPKIENLDIYKFILNEVNEIQSNAQEMNQLKLQNNELLEERINQKKYSIIYNFCRTGPSISMLISFRQFEMAYQQLLQVADIDEQCHLFIHSFLFAVQFNNVTELFKKFLYKTDPDLKETSNLWVHAIHYFRTNGMPYNLLLCYTIRNQLEDAAMVGFDVLKKLTSYDMQVSLLGQIAICLDQALIYRKQMKQVTPPFIPNNDFSISELETFKEKCELQLQISLMCVEQNTPFSHDFDLISSPEGAVSVAALLYLNNDKNSLKSVIKLTGIDMKDVSNKVSEVLSKEPASKILEFWTNLKNHKNELGPDIPYSLLRHLEMSSNRSLIMTIILSFFTSPVEQCMLFLQYGCITEAFSLASQNPDLYDLIPIIGNRAALDGNIVIYDNCMKLLAK